MVKHSPAAADRKHGFATFSSRGGKSRMKNMMFAATLVLVGFLPGCGGGGGGYGGGCASPLLIDPSGVWAGELELQSSTCAGADAGASTLSARHEVFTECVSAFGEEDEELRLVDQDGRSLEEMTYYFALPDGTVSFTVEGDRPMGGAGTETSKIEYEDVRHDRARVAFTRSLSVAGRVQCTEVYSGSLARER